MVHISVFIPTFAFPVTFWNFPHTDVYFLLSLFLSNLSTCYCFCNCRCGFLFHCISPPSKGVDCSQRYCNTRLMCGGDKASLCSMSLLQNPFDVLSGIENVSDIKLMRTDTTLDLSQKGSDWPLLLDHGCTYKSPRSFKTISMLLLEQLIWISGDIFFILLDDSDAQWQLRTTEELTAKALLFRTFYESSLLKLESPAHH